MTPYDSCASPSRSLAASDVAKREPGATFAATRAFSVTSASVLSRERRPARVAAMRLSTSLPFGAVDEAHLAACRHAAHGAGDQRFAVVRRRLRDRELDGRGRVGQAGRGDHRRAPEAERGRIVQRQEERPRVCRQVHAELAGREQGRQRARRVVQLHAQRAQIGGPHTRRGCVR